MADEQQPKDSSVIGRVNSLAGKGKNLQRTYNAYKKVRVAVAAGEGIGSLAGAVPVVIGAIILVVIVIIISGAAPSAVVGSNPSPSPTDLSSGSPGPVTSASPLPTSEIAKYFRFNGATASQQQVIISLFSLPFSSPRYVSLLTSAGPITINIYPPSIPGALTGGANYDNNTINAWGFFEANFSNQMKQHWLIHESIHLIQRRNGMLGFDLNSLQQDGSACYDSLWIKTYAYRSSGYGRGVSCKYPSPPIDYSAQSHESMAEAAADNTQCAPGVSCDLNDYACSAAVNYPSDCSNTYKWIRANIFGGTDFFGLP